MTLSLPPGELGMGLLLPYGPVGSFCDSDQCPRTRYPSREWTRAPLLLAGPHWALPWGPAGVPLAGNAGTCSPPSRLLFRRPFPSEETTENDDDVYRSLEELAE